MNIPTEFQLHLLIKCFLRRRVFNISFANLTFRLPWEPIKFSGSDKIHMVGRGLLKEHFCKSWWLLSNKIWRKC